MEQKTIRICGSHQDRQTPLIWTFAFPGAEYWCPYCGFTGGMFGSGRTVASTKELLDIAKKDKVSTKKFLHATAYLSCSEIMYGGKWYKPKDLPEREKTRLRNIRNNWVYGSDTKTEQ